MIKILGSIALIFEYYSQTKRSNLQHLKLILFFVQLVKCFFLQSI